MAFDRQLAQEIVAELQPIIGGRIQRVDAIDLREIVLAIRCPGRTLHFLVSARDAALARAHLVEQRPPRVVPAGNLQAVLRKRLLGRPLSALRLDGDELLLMVPDATLRVSFRGGKDAFVLTESGEAPPPPSALALPPHFPKNEALAARFEGRDQTARVTRLRASLRRPVEAKLKKLRRLLGRLSEDRGRLLALSERRRWGEMLKPELHSVPRGATQAELIDYQRGAAELVPLDPALNAKQNMERFFAQAKKGERGLPIVEARRLEVIRQQEGLEGRLTTIREASEEELEALLEQQSGAGGEPELRGGRARGPSPVDRVSKAFVSKDGTPIRVGKGAKENDQLTFRFSSGHHFWFHARGATGAHVVLMLGRGATPTQESLLDACHLAVHFSAFRGEPKAEVVYTEVKHLRKPRDGSPGQVLVAKERSMLLRVEPARLSRLLGGEATGEGDGRG